MKNKKISTMNIQYFNENHHKILNMSTMGYAGTGFNIHQYTTHVPSGYKFAGFLTQVPQAFDEHNHNIDIKVVPLAQRPKVPNRMVVRFLNIDHNNMEVEQDAVSNDAKVSFNVKDYLSRHIPRGYSFKKIKGQAPTRFNGTQLIQVEVAPKNDHQSKLVTHNSSALGKMIIQYLDANNQVKNQSIIFGQSGSHFDVDKYTASKFIPQGYVFKGIKDAKNVPQIFNGTQTVRIMITSNK